MTDKRQERPQRSNVNAMSLLQNSSFSWNIFFFTNKYLSFAVARLQYLYMICTMHGSCHQVYFEALAPHIKPGTILIGLAGNPEFEVVYN